MGLDAPFMYAPIEKTQPNAPYKPFDPHAVSRASMEPKTQKPRQTGPYIQLNAHPDSHLPPRTNLMPHISKTLKNNVKRTRKAVMTLRIIQFAGALLALTMMILIKAPTNTVIIWCMRVAPGVSALHCLYGIYHLARRSSGRTPASSASYMLFASTFDVAVIAFYVLGGYTAYWEWDPQALRTHDAEEAWTTWSSILHDAAPNTDIAGIFKMCVTLAFCVSGFFHLLTLGLSLWLFAMFRKIVRMPPDMNPLEDNLTSRTKAHKRNKSSIASESTWDDDSKSARFSQYTQRRSGAPYEDLSRPPSIPFMHTRTNSSTTLGSHSSIPVGTSPRDSRMDLPSRIYGVAHAGSPTASQIDLKRSSMASLPGSGSTSPIKRGSYAAVPQQGEQIWMGSGSPSKARDPRATNRRSMPNMAGKSTRAAPLNSGPANTNTNTSPARQTNFGSRYGRYDSGNDSGNDSDIGSSVVSRMTDPLQAHPIQPVGKQAKQALSPTRIEAPKRESALSQMTLNRMNTVATNVSSVYSTDELGNPVNGDGEVGERRSELERLEEEREARRFAGRQLTPSPKKNGRTAYGELRGSGMGEVPQLVGRNVSTGNDIGLQKGFRREVSGKVAEEGRGGWGARFRKVSGLGGQHL